MRMFRRNHDAKIPTETTNFDNRLARTDLLVYNFKDQLKKLKKISQRINRKPHKCIGIAKNKKKTKNPKDIKSRCTHGAD